MPCSRETASAEQILNMISTQGQVDESLSKLHPLIFKALMAERISFADKLELMLGNRSPRLCLHKAILLEMLSQFIE